MTGFKLHHPPGFVDRAYLVFLVAVTNSPDYRLTTVLESLSPPCRFELSAPALSRGTSPVAPGRHHHDSLTFQRFGEKLGRSLDRPELQAPSPRRSLPLLRRVRGRTDPCPVSARGTEQATCQRQVVVRPDSRRSFKTLPWNNLGGPAGNHREWRHRREHYPVTPGRNGNSSSSSAATH